MDESPHKVNCSEHLEANKVLSSSSYEKPGTDWMRFRNREGC